MTPTERGARAIAAVLRAQGVRGPSDDGNAGDVGAYANQLASVFVLGDDISRGEVVQELAEAIGRRLEERGLEGRGASAVMIALLLCAAWDVATGLDDERCERFCVLVGAGLALDVARLTCRSQGATETALAWQAERREELLDAIDLALVDEDGPRISLDEMKRELGMG